MKKISFTLFFALLFITIQAQTSKNPIKILELTKMKFQVETSGIDKLSLLDIEILALMPLLKDYEQVEVKLKTLTDEKIKMIDSIDFSRVNNSYYTVKFYLQNYAYKSSNSYRLVVDKKSKNQGLLLTYMKYDMKIKDIIDDYEAIRDKKISYTIQRKTLKDKFNTQRIIVTKTDV